MSISNTDTLKVYNGNTSTTTPYPIPWKYYNENENTVFADDVDITSTVTFLGDGSSNFGEFTTQDAYDSSVSIIVILNMPLTQPVELSPVGPLPTETIEEGIADRLNQQLRTIYRKVTQGVHFKGYSPIQPEIEVEPNTIIGFDVNNFPVLIPEEYLTDLSGIAQAVAACAASESAAALSALAAQSSEAVALSAATDAANSAISAKGFITIPTEALTQLPILYPQNQVSVMPAGPGAASGNWPYEGTVITNSFIAPNYNPMVYQTYIPNSTVLNQPIKMRIGLDNGSGLVSLWSPFLELTDGLSRSNGGTVIGNTTFSGDLTLTGNVTTSEEIKSTATPEPLNDGEVLLPAYETASLLNENNCNFIDVTKLNYSSVGVGITNTYDKGIPTSYIFGMDFSDYAQAPFGSPVGYSFISGQSRYLNTQPYGLTSKRDFVIGGKIDTQLPDKSRYVFSAADENINTLLTASDEGIQFIIERDSGYKLRILLSDGTTLSDTGYTTIPDLVESSGKMLCKISHNGKMLIYMDVPGLGYVEKIESTFNHPWINGAFTNNPKFPSFLISRISSGSGTAVLSISEVFSTETNIIKQ